jgi:DNA-binding FadR family transcriptional regulator
MVEMKMTIPKLNSELLAYLIRHEVAPGDRLPALPELAVQLGVSVGKLREQLEVARHLELISVRPRHGMRRESFSFLPGIRASLLFSLASGEGDFQQFSQLRRIIETNLWDEAVVLLTEADKRHLQDLVAKAWEKLRSDPVHIPNGEHRDLHLTIFSRLENPFAQGFLQAYWDAYDTIELTRLADLHYWLAVWQYHEQIVEALCANNWVRGRQLLVEHFDLLPTTWHS